MIQSCTFGGVRKSRSLSEAIDETNRVNISFTIARKRVDARLIQYIEAQLFLLFVISYRFIRLSCVTKVSFYSFINYY
jgi:hypothetical protein